MQLATHLVSIRIGAIEHGTTHLIGISIAGGKPLINFEMQQDVQKKWRCLNDKRIGGTTAAREAYHQAAALMKSRTLSEALAYYDKSISLDPNCSPA